MALGAAARSADGEEQATSHETALRKLKVLVTGGLGFIGSNLARRLVELEADVLVIDSMLPNTGANWANLKDIEGKLHIQVVDLRNSVG